MGGARGEGEATWQGSAQVPETPPREPGHHAKHRLPGWPWTAVRPDGGGTPHGTWPRHKTCVGQAIVQGDEGPVSGVAQGVEDHGVAGVRHEEEKEEGRVEQEVEGEKEENNTQGRRHMCMDGMKVKRQMRSALSLEPK